MPKVDEGAKAWEMDLAGRIGTAVQTRRKQLKMTAQQLAARAKELGYPISRVAISKIETNTRAGKFDIAELVVLAAALEVPPVTLLFGGPPDEEVEMLPDWTGPAFFGIAWFSGDRDLAWPGPDVVNPDEAFSQYRAAINDPESTAAKVLERTRDRARLHRELAMSRFVSKAEAKAWDDEQFDRAVQADAERIRKIDEINAAIANAVADNQGESE